MTEHSFGSVGSRALIRSEAHPSTTNFGDVATAYIVKDEGRVIQPLGDRAGSLIQLPATQEVDALGRAVRYLEKRFGQVASAPNWPQVLGRVEEEEVLRDERQE
jgi:hypothetical protein